MQCPNCGKNNKEDSNFCAHCGCDLRQANLSADDTSSSDEKVNKKKEIVEFIPPSGYEFYYSPGENAYAECVGISATTGAYHFKCIDKISEFHWKKEFAEKNGMEFKKKDKIWVNLKKQFDSSNYSYMAVPLNEEISGRTYLDFQNFSKYHKEGDIIYAPIAEVANDYFYVQIGIKAQTKIMFKDVPSYVKKDKIKKGQVKRFKIASIQKNTENKTSVRLLLAEDQFMFDKRQWGKLPINIKGNKDVYIFQKSLDLIKENEEVCKLLFNDLDPSLKDLVEVLDKKYTEAYSTKQIYISKSKNTLFFDFDLGIRNHNGVPQSACFKRREGDRWTLCMVGFSSAECMLERFVYIPDWTVMLSDLSEMALGNEDWDYKGRHKGQKIILRNYLLFGFYKSWLDGLIIEENGEALINTGLVDGSYDDIFCYFKKNTCEDDFYGRKWEYGCFACRGKGAKGKRLNDKFKEFPNAPSYIDTDNISNLYFNPSKSLYCDYKHIIEDNLKRFPIDFLRSRLCYDQSIASAINTYEATNDEADFSVIMNMVNEDSDKGERFRRDLQSGLKDAVETAIKYCRWNYKTAIPIYYPRNNSISLLLPLKLQTDPKVQVDVALVVERLQNGNYQGQTILTLQMAYQDARQICRPNSEWLTLNNIVDSETKEESKEGE